MLYGESEIAGEGRTPCSTGSLHIGKIAVGISPNLRSRSGQLEYRRPGKIQKTEVAASGLSILGHVHPDLRCGAGNVGGGPGALTTVFLRHLVGFLLSACITSRCSPQGPVLALVAYDIVTGFPPWNRPTRANWCRYRRAGQGCAVLEGSAARPWKPDSCNRVP